MDPVSTTRHRSDSKDINNRSEWSTHFTYSETPSEYSASIGDGTYVSRDMYDNVTPNWTSKRYSGEVVMNDMQQTKQTVIFDSPATGTSSSYHGWYSKNADAELSTFHLFSGAIFPQLPSIDDERFDNDMALAITRLHSSIQREAVDVLTAMCEGVKSVRTLNRAFRAAWWLLKNVRKLRRLQIRGIVSAAHVADAYLEIRYGLRPIVYDIMGTIEALQGMNEPRRGVVHIAQLCEDHNSSSQGTLVKTIGSGSYTINATYQTADILENIIRAGAVLQFENSEKHVFDEFGFDSLETAWELVPFSFIADWFFNIGNVIASWTPKFDVDILGTYISLEETARREAICSNLIFGATGKSADDLSHNGTYVKTSRVRRYGNPSKPWLPRLDINLDGLKLLDTLAIFGGAATDFRRWRI